MTPFALVRKNMVLTHTQGVSIGAFTATSPPIFLGPLSAGKRRISYEGLKGIWNG
jgi:hypothetical protein